jgi:hypothetical protein
LNILNQHLLMVSLLNEFVLNEIKQVESKFEIKQVESKFEAQFKKK